MAFTMANAKAKARHIANGLHSGAHRPAAPCPLASGGIGTSGEQFSRLFLEKYQWVIRKYWYVNLLVMYNCDVTSDKYKLQYFFPYHHIHIFPSSYLTISPLKVSFFYLFWKKIKSGACFHVFTTSIIAVL